MELNHLYFMLLKRVYRCQWWEEVLFSSLYNENPLDDLSFTYWENYIRFLSETEDGYLLVEQSELNTHRSNWLEGTRSINCMYRSKGYVPHVDIFSEALRWMSSHGTSDSVVELLCFA
jgi:hypothetical protein